MKNRYCLVCGEEVNGSECCDNCKSNEIICYWN